MWGGVERGEGSEGACERNWTCGFWVSFFKGGLGIVCERADLVLVSGRAGSTEVRRRERERKERRQSSLLLHVSVGIDVCRLLGLAFSEPTKRRFLQASCSVWDPENRLGLALNRDETRLIFVPAHISIYFVSFFRLWPNHQPLLYITPFNYSDSRHNFRARVG